MTRRLVPACLALLLAACHAKEEAPPKPVVEVKTVAAEEAEVQTTVRAPATVFAREQANLAGRITATIRELKAKKGDWVAAGQILATLENRDLVAQRNEAIAAVHDAEATLAKVTSGTVPTDIEKGRGQVATAQAALDQAQKFYDRRKQLYEQGAIPNRDLQVSQTELAQANTAYEVAKKSLELLVGQSKERDIQVAQSRVEQARSHLEVLQSQLAYAELRSPFAGAITEQFLFPGDMAKPEAPIFTLADLAVAVARAQVPEAEATAVRKGEACSLEPGDQKDVKFTGRVTVVNQAVDPARRTVEVWCEIGNGQRQLRAGVFGEVTIVTGTLEKAVVVPLAAVQFEEGTRKGFVLVAGKDRKAAKREIEAGPTGAGRVPITKGLAAGEIVIVEGGYGLADGTDVKWAEAGKK